eukprot:547961-Amphidinium_carterae.1
MGGELHADIAKLHKGMSGLLEKFADNGLQLDSLQAPVVPSLPLPFHGPLSFYIGYMWWLNAVIVMVLVVVAVVLLLVMDL